MSALPGLLPLFPVMFFGKLQQSAEKPFPAKTFPQLLTDRRGWGDQFNLPRRSFGLRHR